MPPKLALALCLCGIFWMFRCDMKLRRAASKAVWIPALWLAVISCRPASYWLSLLGIGEVSESNLAGSPVDLAVYMVLIGFALIILVRRRLAFAQVLTSNKVLVAVYAFFLVSTLWADHPFPTLKRVVKDFGSVFVALVILTEKDPLATMRLVFSRVAYVLFPISLITIKWFPSIGMTNSRGGDRIFSGVCEHKSSLGSLVFCLGLVILCDLVLLRKVPAEQRRTKDTAIRLGMLVLSLWLLLLCKSVTSLLCFILGGVILWGTGLLMRLSNPAQMLVRCVAVFCVLGAAEMMFDVSGAVLQLFGKDRTLTDRTMIWEMVTSAQSNRLLGSGYFSFWESSVAERTIAQFAGQLRTAHNGYIETYLDGGIVGLSLLVILLLVWLRGSIAGLLRGTFWGRMVFMYWVLGVMFNNSETAFFRLHPLWFTLLVTMIVCPRVFQQRAPVSNVKTRVVSSNMVKEATC